MIRRGLTLLWPWGAIVLVAAGCDQRAASTPQASVAPIEQTVTAGAPDRPMGVCHLTLDRSNMTVAERARLTLRIEIDAAVTDVTIDPPLPDPPADRLGDFVVASRAVRTLPEQDGRRVTEHALTLEPFLDGSKAIPPLRIKFVTPEGTTEVVTDAATVQVESVLSEQDRKAEVLPLSPAPEVVALTAPTPPKDWRPAAIVAGSTAMGGLAITLLLVQRRRRRALPLDPVAHARRRLGQLQATITAAIAEPFGAESQKLPSVASELAAVVRTYLQEALGVPAIGATVAELTQLARGHQVLAQQPEQLAQLLDTVRDLEHVAFAPEQPRAAVLAEHLATIDRFITHTASLAVTGTNADARARRAA